MSENFKRTDKWLVTLKYPANENGGQFVTRTTNEYPPMWVLRDVCFSFMSGLQKREKQWKLGEFEVQPILIGFWEISI